MPDEKTRLTIRLMDHFARNGFADTSLRPLAASVGSSARMLIYHFGSKEQLFVEVLKAMQIELRSSLVTLLGLSARADADRPPLRRVWDWAIKPKNLAHLKLIYELQVLAVGNPELYRGYLQQEAEDWLEFALTAMSPERRDPQLASVCVAIFDGLMLDVITGGDKRQATRTLERFIQLATSAPVHSGHRPVHRKPS